jgi:glycosyltransferase involved in cell wall biosynthesis
MKLMAKKNQYNVKSDDCYSIELVIADTGWIMERLAKEIQKASKIKGQNLKVDIVTTPSGDADLTFFLPYSIQKKLKGTIIVSQFTHQETIEPAKSKFIQNALIADHCITNSKKYERVLVEAGVKKENISVIYHGVDIDIFKPKVRIGVVGRTYHTGRKGETLLAEVANIPGIEFVFIGDGWPLPSENYSNQSDMAKFYNDIDYLLIPSFIEGGPVPFFEALASGCQVISGDVGCVEDFPHIPFKTGDSKDLKKVVLQLIKEKSKLRESVVELTWGYYGKEHINTFLKIIKSNKHKKIKNTRLSQINKRLPSVMLLLHGTEKISKGGPSNRIEILNHGLNLKNVNSCVNFNVPVGSNDYQIYHVFNSWPLNSALDQIKAAKLSGKKVVFSPITLNLTYKPIFEKILPNILLNCDESTLLAEVNKLKEITPVQNFSIDSDDIETIEGYQGHFKILKDCVHLSDGVIFLSEYEKHLLTKIGASKKNSKVIRNTTDLQIMEKGDSTLFKKKFGLTRYILCVGRIETRKNQAVLALASKTLSLPIVYIGHVGDNSYFELLKLHSNNEFIHIDRIENRELLASAYKGADALVLNSWTEGASLTALEAGAAGTPLILSNMSSEKEYFDEWAEYIHPCDVSRLKDILERIKSKPEDEKKREARSKWVVKNYSIETHVSETLDFYNHILPPPKGRVNHSLNEVIYVDITHISHALDNGMNLTGVTSLEKQALDVLIELDNTQFIVWNSPKRRFLTVERKEIRNKTFSRLANSRDINNEVTNFYSREVEILVSGNIDILDCESNYKRLIKNIFKRSLSLYPKFLRTRIVHLIRVFRPQFNPDISNNHSTKSLFVKNSNRSKPVFSTKTYFKQLMAESGNIQVPKNSKLYMFGNPWISNDKFISDIEEFIHLNSINFSFILPDILFVTDSESFNECTREAYKSRLLKMLALSKNVMAISNSAKKDIENFINIHKLDINVDRLYLPKAIDAGKEEVVRCLKGERFILYVSSFNNRKNHDFIISVWKELHRIELVSNVEECKLVFVGTAQSGFEKFSDNNYKKQLEKDNIFIMNSINNEQLKWLYKNSLFTIYPSISEGWGFPVQESLFFGKLCIASRSVPSAIEEKSTGIIRLDPKDFFGWYSVLKNLIFNKPMRDSFEKNAKNWKETSTWEDTIRKAVGCKKY